MMLKEIADELNKHNPLSGIENLKRGRHKHG